MWICFLHNTKQIDHDFIFFSFVVINRNTLVMIANLHFSDFILALVSKEFFSIEFFCTFLNLLSHWRSSHLIHWYVSFDVPVFPEF